jgi:hypothetical protein
MGIGLIPDLVTSWLDHKAQKKGAKQVIGQWNDYQTGATNALTGARDASVAGFQPFLQGGQAQFQQAQNMLTPGYQYGPSDPSYAWRFGEGMNALTRQQSASGTLQSGGGEKAAMRFGQGLASTEFGNDFNRRNQLAQFGLQAAGGNAQVQSNYGREMSDVFRNAAEGRSAGYLGKANAKSQLYGDITGAFENAAQDFAQIFGGF